MFLFSLDQASVAVALPQLASQLHHVDRIGWVVAAYLLATAVAAPLWGRLGEVITRKGAYEASIAVFVLGSLLAALSSSFGWLVAARAVQGLGGGGLLVCAQAIVVEVVPLERRGRYLRLFGVIFGLAVLVGPLVGGVLTQRLSWRWIFLINVPLGIAALLAVHLLLHVPMRRARHHLDVSGCVSLVIAVSSMVSTITLLGAGDAWPGVGLLVSAATSVAAITVFVSHERRAPEPIVPRGVLADRAMVLLMVLAVVVGCCILGELALIPLYLQTVRGLSPTLSGIAILPLMAGMIVTFNLSRVIMFRTGRIKALPALGFLLVSTGSFALAMIDGSAPFGEVAAFLFTIGLGAGLVLQVLVLAIQVAAPPGLLGQATALESLSRALGAVIGVSVLNAVLIARVFERLAVTTGSRAEAASLVRNLSLARIRSDHPSGITRAIIGSLTDGAQSMFFVGASVAICGTIVALLVPGSRLRVGQRD